MLCEAMPIGTEAKALCVKSRVTSMKGGEIMGNLFKRLLSKVLASELDKRKERLRGQLQAQINTTQSSWVKTRNQLYINLLDIAGETMISKMEKEILK